MITILIKLMLTFPVSVSFLFFPFHKPQSAAYVFKLIYGWLLKPEAEDDDLEITLYNVLPELLSKSNQVLWHKKN